MAVENAVSMSTDEPFVQELFDLQQIDMQRQWLIERRDKTRPSNLIARASTGRRISAEDKKRAALVASMTPDGFHAIAWRVVDNQVKRWRAEKPSTRHTYHRETLADLSGDVVRRLADQAVNATISVRAGSSGAIAEARVAEVPELSAWLVEESVRVLIEQEVDHYAKIADDDVMLTAWSEPTQADGEAEPSRLLVVQHKASGLRASFDPGRVGKDGAKRPGLVYSKSYTMDSLDPDRPDPFHDWKLVVGLGIGMKVYRHGAAELPEERWGYNSPSDMAIALRRKLHALDPYRWEYLDCEWCDERAITWQWASPEAFEGHR